MDNSRFPGTCQTSSNYPTPVFLPEESIEEPDGYSPQVHKELDMTEVTEHACTTFSMTKGTQNILESVVFGLLMQRPVGDIESKASRIST